MSQRLGNVNLGQAQPKTRCYNATSTMNTSAATAQQKYRWYLLGMSAATSTFVQAIPFSCMPVLFEEISRDLNLNLVQIGTVWGMASLAGVFVSIVGGMLGDRFGLKLVLGIACLLVGITGALRGLSNGFVMLTTLVFVNGIVRAIVPINITKAVALWFRGRNLGMANGVGAMGMGLGLMLGPAISATILSPFLGGWRNVMFFYGALSTGVAVFWFFAGKQPATEDARSTPVQRTPVGKALPVMLRNKTIWLIGFMLLFRSAGITGMTGYLPLYLVRNQGWSEGSAGSTLAVFYAVSTAAVIALSTLSDRIGSRKAILVPGLVIMTASLALLPVVPASGVWLLMIVSGLFMDSFMSITVTTLIETEGIGIDHAGLALGIVFTIAPLGGAIAAPVGNSLAPLGAGVPFFFWAALSVVALVAIFFIRETGWRRKRVGS
jgi:MFS family permease